MSQAPAEVPDVELLRLALDLSPAGALVVDENGLMLLANREIQRLFGYSSAELLGHPIEMLLPVRYRGHHPELRRHYFSTATARPMGTGRELHGLRKDGTEFPVEIGLNPVRETGRTVVLASVVDISARRRAEQRFEAAVESAPSGMVMTDEAGIILLVNREVERLFGFTRQELIGTPVERLVPERFRAAHPGHRAAFFNNALARPMGAGRDLYGLRKDGREVAIEIGLNPIRTDEGVRVLSSIVDVTQRRQMEGHMRQSHKLEAIGTLASGIAHDFNNILLSIIGHTELALAATSVDAQVEDDMAQVLSAAERGRQLVQRILTFSRQSDVTRVPLRVADTVHEALQLLRASLPTTIEIRENLRGDAPVVLSDETQLHQIVMNLATNAAHAMRGGGVLEVQLQPVVLEARDFARHPSLRPGRYALLSVIDTGAGMSEETLKRAFDPFFTTKGPGEGTGLGLAVVHGIVEAHHGAIEIQSELGAGTRVLVYLPAHAAGVVNAPESEADERPHVLLVEDEAPIARMLQRQLQMLGCRVTAHTSSFGALGAFQSQPDAFDLLITDNTMPQMTGLALAQRIREQAPALPILLISGLAQTADANELMASGVSQVMAKPHTMSALRAAVERLLGRGLVSNRPPPRA